MKFGLAGAGMALLCSLLAGQAIAAVTPLEYRGGYSVLGNMLGVAGLAAGDLDGDGRSEIVVTGTDNTFGGAGLFNVLRADATAPGGYAQVSFSEPFAAGLNTLSLLDLDGNGVPEIVVGLDDGVVRAYSGLGLEVHAETNIGSPVRQILLADANNDGATDLVVVGSATLKLLDPQTLASRGSLSFVTTEAAVGDVDGDGLKEVVLASGKVLRLSGLGPTLAAQELWSNPSGAFGMHIGLADIDNDGKQELIAESDWDYLTAYDLDLHSPKWQIPQLGDLDAMALTDVTGDGIPEALLGSGQWGSVRAISLLTKATLWSVNNPEHGVGHVLVADVDAEPGDELLWTGGWSSTGKDVLYAYALPSRTEKWRTTHIDGPFEAVALAPAAGSAPSRVAFASFSSGSGYNDGIVSQWNAATLAPLTGTGPNTFGGFAFTGLHALAYGDVDNDGALDLVVGTDRLYDGAIYVLDAATGATKTQYLYDDGSPINALVVSDLDHDNHSEIVAANFVEHTGSPGTYVYVFDGATGAELWRSVSLVSGFGSVVDLAVDDVNGGGIKDIVAVAGGWLFLFDGVTHVQWQSPATGYNAVTTHDLDGDGRAEILVGRSDGNVQVLDGISHVVLGTVPAGTSAVAALRVFRDPASHALRLAALVDGRLRVFDLASATQTAEAAHAIEDSRGLAVGDAEGDNQMDFYVGSGTAFRAYRLPNDSIFVDAFEVPNP